MHHDQAAEMAAYSAELAGAEQRRDAAHARAIREQIGLRFGSPDQLHDRADAYEAAGRQGSAARARALAAAVADEEPAPPGDDTVREQVAETAENQTEPTSAPPPAAENTADATPKETAVTRRGRSKES